jgi:NDP-sugar pyrophosphorylase family protein
MLNGTDICLGRGCRIDNNSVIHNSIIWDNVVVNEGVWLDRTIIADGVVIPPGREFANAAIVRAEMLLHGGPAPETAARGYFDDENYIVPLV